MLHGHGGNISAVARRYGLKPSEIIDMSSNINPLGPPEGLLDFLKDHLKSLTALPEVDSRQSGIEFAETCHGRYIDTKCAGFFVVTICFG